jgi:hypothetical protein
MNPAENNAEAEASDEQVAPKAKKPTATKPSDMSDGLVEFIQAIDEYKRVQQRPFPSWGEVYGVMRELGYEQPGGEQKSA